MSKLSGNMVDLLRIHIFTQRRSIAKSVAYFQRRLFVCVCLFVCQHDNFGKSKHRMMKLVARCIVQKSQPSSTLGVIASECAPQNMTMGYEVGKISSGYLHC